MNWKWILGALGVAGVVAFFTKGASRTIAVEHGSEGEVTRSGAPSTATSSTPSTPSTPSTSTTTSAGDWSFAPFIVEVIIRANFFEKPIVLQQVREGGADLARQLVDQLPSRCPGSPMPFAGGTRPRSVVADIVPDGVRLIASWPPVVWSGSTPELTSCILRLLRGLPDGERVLRVVVR